MESEKKESLVNEENEENLDNNDLIFLKNLSNVN